MMLTREEFDARCLADEEFAQTYEDFYHYIRLENAATAKAEELARVKEATTRRRNGR